MEMRSAISIVMTVLGLLGTLHAQHTVSSDVAKVPGALARMKSGDLHTQKLAFDDLMDYVNSETTATNETAAARTRSEALERFFTKHPAYADQVKMGLIGLLKQENHYFIESKNPPPDPHEEDDISEHYAQVIDVVSSLDDERAVPALVGAMTTGGMAQRALMKYGDKALVPVMTQLKNPDALVRATALAVSVALLEQQNDSTSHTRIRELIRSALVDPRPVVRTRAVQEIGCLDDRADFVPVLQQIANSDPWKLPGKGDDGGDGGQFYPVRFDARQVLRDIRDGRTCAH